MADQEFLASFGVDIDETGVSRLQQILTENQTLAKSLSDSFNAASESVKAFREQVTQDLPSLFSGSGHGNVSENLFGSAGGLKIGLNMTEPKKEIASFTADAKKPIALSANASGIVSAARTALENVRSLFSETFTINVRASTNTDDGDGKEDGNKVRGSSTSVGMTRVRMSTGGRFTSPTDVQVAEDGDAEYIIPVKKEGRALPLIRRLLSELSPEARQSLTAPEQKAVTEGETQDIPVPLNVISPSTEEKPEQSPVPDLRQVLSEADRPLVTAPIAEKQGTPEKNITAPAPIIRETFAEVDHPLPVAPATEKEEFSEADGSVPVLSPVSEDRQANQVIDLSALLKELSETGKELLSAPQPNTAPASTEKEHDPQFSVPVLVPAEKETASQLSVPAPAPTEKEQVPQLSAPIPAPVEREPVPQFSAPVPMPAEKEPVPQFSVSVPVPVAKEEKKEKEEKKDAVSPVTLPAIREVFAEADHPLAPVPAAQTESLPSVASSPKQDLSELVSRLSSMIQPSGNTVTNTSNNLSAPVTINVNARGSDAEQIGETIYNTAERYLIRTLRSSFQF